MALESGGQPWWLRPLPDLQAELTSQSGGLSSAEANSRLSRFGPNLFRDRQQQSALAQFLTRSDMLQSYATTPSAL